MPKLACDIIAHRGASGIAAEDNTRSAFLHAIALGCDYLETDLRRCKDGTIVCFHDAHIKQVALSDISFSELKTLAGQDILNLDQFLDLCATKIGLDIEIKEPGFEKELLARLAQYPIQDTVIIKSFDAQALLTLRKLKCSYPLGLLIGGCPAQVDLAAHLSQHRAIADSIIIDFVSPHKNLVADSFFKKDTFANVRCLVWTVDQPNEMRNILKFPVHGIITNRPDRLQFVCQTPPRNHSAAEIKAALKTYSTSELISYFSYSSYKNAHIVTHSVDIGNPIEGRVQAWIDACWPKQSKLCVVYDNDMDPAFIKPYLNLPSMVESIALSKQASFTHLTPHLSYCEQVRKVAKNCNGLIAIGSGTINDICKYAAHLLNVPYIAVATAASMNGYTSGIAALLVDDLKSTLNCKPPLCVLSNADIIQRAPLNLLQSGYADLLSKFVSVSDWKLASLIRGEAFDDIPGDIAGNAIDQCILVAEQIRQQDSAACAELMNAIILSGYSMALAGSSAPASGGEHLISHYLDMTAYGQQQCPELHGLQVALGTLLSSRLYEYMRAADPQSFKPRLYSTAELETAHGGLWPIIEKTASAQIKTETVAQERLNDITRQWKSLWTELSPYLKSHLEISRALKAAGVACNPEAYGIDRVLMKRALCFAADIRDRYTILHFARDCGVLENIADDIIASAFS